MKKFIIIIICITLSAVMLTSTVFADWETNDDKTYYTDEQGNFKTGWQKIDGKDYFFKQDGEMTTKSAVIDGIRYKFSSDGVCHGKYSGWTKSPAGYKYWENGIPFKNKWINAESGKRYYAGDSGIIIVGWFKIENNWYYFDKNGVMSDVYSEIVDNFSKYDEYGGTYFEDNILHLESTSPSLTKSKVEKFCKSEDMNELAENIVIDKVKYSYTELYTAKKSLRDKMNKYNIVGTYIDPKTNSIIVEVENPSKEMIEVLKDLTGIENINYEIVEDSKMIDDVSED